MSEIFNTTVDGKLRLNEKFSPFSGLGIHLFFLNLSPSFDYIFLILSIQNRMTMLQKFHPQFKNYNVGH